MTKSVFLLLWLPFPYFLLIGEIWAQANIYQPADNTEFYYSVGVGDQQATAEQNARVNLASRLDSSISTIMQLQYSSMNGLEQTRVSTIDEVSTEMVPMPKAQLLESKYSAGVWHALIKVSKQQLKQRLVNKLNELEQNLKQFQASHVNNNSFSCFIETIQMKKLLRQYIKTSVLAESKNLQEEGSLALSIRKIINRCNNQNYVYMETSSDNECTETLKPKVTEVIRRFLVITPSKTKNAGVLKINCELQRLQMGGNFLSKITLSIDVFDEKSFRWSFPDIHTQAQSFVNAEEADKTALATIKNEIRIHLEEKWTI